MTRKYQPEEFHGLSAVDANAMIASGLSRADWDRSRLFTAHGDLCIAMVHLRRAETYFRPDHPALAGKLDRLARELAPEIPSYGEFSRAALQSLHKSP